jgi:putative sugar O-methyltransferase
VSDPQLGDDLEDVLDSMEAEVESAGGIYAPSKFWRALNRLNREQLREAGFAHFKRTVNQNYFNWVFDRSDPQVQAVMEGMTARAKLRTRFARLLDNADIEAGFNRGHPFQVRRVKSAYAPFVAALWEIAHRRDRLRLLDILEEPLLGDPVLVRHRSRLISQDLGNSVLELYAVLDAVPPATVERGVLEVGAGYGRLAWAFLHAFPAARYVIVDVPPALGIAQEYLTRLMPHLPSFRFRHFDRWVEVADEAQTSQLLFLTPNQLAMANLEVGLVVNVSSFHEMRPETIAAYLEQSSRLAPDGFLYSKQWIEWHNDVDDVTMRRGEYPIPADWTLIYDRVHPVQRHFFEALYRIHSPVGEDAAHHM